MKNYCNTFFSQSGCPGWLSVLFLQWLLYCYPGISGPHKETTLIPRFCSGTQPLLLRRGGGQSHKYIIFQALSTMKALYLNIFYVIKLSGKKRERWVTTASGRGLCSCWVCVLLVVLSLNHCGIGFVVLSTHTKKKKKKKKGVENWQW